MALSPQERRRRMQLMLLSAAAFYSTKASFTPLSLFASGEQGFWYDPSDFTTMFQDDAGTTPVTAVEQPVGLIRDKSGRGNHASQGTSASRPVLSARYNLLERTENFSDTYWTKTNLTIGSGIADPDGGSTAFAFTAQAANATISRGIGSLKSGSPITCYIRRRTGSGAIALWTGSAYTNITVTAYWQRVIVTQTSLTAGYFDLRIAVSGDAVDVWHPDIREVTDGVGLPAYQRVTTATDYDTTGFPMYLKFDGVDDSLATGTIDFTATDKMSVFAGVRKLSDAVSLGLIAELSANINANNGAFAVWTGGNSSPGASYRTATKGTVISLPSIPASYASPISNVISGLFDISGDIATSRIDGAQVAQATTDQGTGNYGNYPLYIGRRGGSSLPYNGHLYSLVVRGAASTYAQIASTETYVNNLTKAY